MFSNYHKKYRNILKSMKGRNDIAKKVKSKEFKNQADRILCDLHMQVQIFSECNCVEKKKYQKENKHS